MSRFHTQIEVPRGIQETFAFVSDLRNAGKWDPNVEAASMLTPGPIGLATMFRLDGAIYIPFTRVKPPWVGALVMPYAVVSFEPPSEDAREAAPQTARIRLEGQNSVMRYVDTITFKGDDTTTTLDYDALLELTGMLSLAGWFLPQLAAWVGDSATRGMRQAIMANVALPSASDARLAPEVRHAP